MREVLTKVMKSLAKVREILGEMMDSLKSQLEMIKGLSVNQRIMVDKINDLIDRIQVLEGNPSNGETKSNGESTLNEEEFDLVSFLQKAAGIEDAEEQEEVDISELSTMLKNVETEGREIPEEGLTVVETPLGKRMYNEKELYAHNETLKVMKQMGIDV